MTMREVADLAGVSVAAVSRYLNGGYVSADKSERIKRAIEETGYVRSNQARSLRTGATRLIGVVVPKINSESISRLTAGISAVLQRNGYQMLLANTANDPGAELEYLELLRSHPVDGIIIAGTVVTERHREFFASAGVPVVVTGQQVSDCSCVYFDDYEAARDLGSHIASQAPGPIAYIGVTREDTAAGAARQDGFCAGLRDAGVPFDPELYRESPFSIEGGYQAAWDLMRHDPAPAFVGCATDMIAAGALRALTESGISHPETRVSGFGDNQLLAMLTGGIATVHYGYKTCGETAARMVLDEIKEGGRAEHQSACIEHTLITR
ncbi:MAG: LacI family DNA-binding transcriptional regulator [Coriobacteriaceae bacterium]|nr:LacI family DNA-binding transcriptional regulator [Coriobacteriaceae bacterium]